MEGINTNLIQQAKVAQTAAPQKTVQSNPIAPNTPAPAPAQVPQQTEVASKEANAAITAYAQAQVLPKTPTPDEYVAKLTASGKVEGKDFKLEADEGFKEIHEFDGNGNANKISVWKNIDGKDKYMGYETYAYDNNGRKIMADNVDEKDKKVSHSHYYYNDQTPQSVVSHDGFTIETKPEDYKKDLDAKGTKYVEKEETDKFGNKNHIIETFDADGSKGPTTVWVDTAGEGDKGYAYRVMYDKAGKESVSVYYDEEKAVVTNYFN